MPSATASRQCGTTWCGAGPVWGGSVDGWPRSVERCGPSASLALARGALAVADHPPTFPAGRQQEPRRAAPPRVPRDGAAPEEGRADAAAAQAAPQGAASRRGLARAWPAPAAAAACSLHPSLPVPGVGRTLARPPMPTPSAFSSPAPIHPASPRHPPPAPRSSWRLTPKTAARWTSWGTRSRCGGRGRVGRGWRRAGRPHARDGRPAPPSIASRECRLRPAPYRPLPIPPRLPGPGRARRGAGHHLQGAGGGHRPCG
jgi:hypothetical protein